MAKTKLLKLIVFVAAVTGSLLVNPGVGDAHTANWSNIRVRYYAESGPGGVSGYVNGVSTTFRSVGAWSGAESFWHKHASGSFANCDFGTGANCHVHHCDGRAPGAFLSDANFDNDDNERSETSATHSGNIGIINLHDQDGFVANCNCKLEMEINTVRPSFKAGHGFWYMDTNGDNNYDSGESFGSDNKKVIPASYVNNDGSSALIPVRWRDTNSEPDPAYISPANGSSYSHTRTAVTLIGEATDADGDDTRIAIEAWRKNNGASDSTYVRIGYADMNDSGSSWSNLTAPGANHGADLSVSAGRTYRWRVRARDQYGIDSSPLFTGYRTFTIADPPEAVLGITAVDDNGTPGDTSDDAPMAVSGFGYSSCPNPTPPGGCGTAPWTMTSVDTISTVITAPDTAVEPVGYDFSIWNVPSNCSVAAPREITCAIAVGSSAVATAVFTREASTPPPGGYSVEVKSKTNTDGAVPTLTGVAVTASDSEYNGSTNYDLVSSNPITGVTLACENGLVNFGVPQFVVKDGKHYQFITWQRSDNGNDGVTSDDIGDSTSPYSVCAKADDLGDQTVITAVYKLLSSGVIEQ